MESAGRMRVRTLTHLDDIPAEQWNSLVGTENPFLSHAFLSALERHQVVVPSNGWQAMHLILESEAGTLLAAMPAYLKGHSWGEFVFDWAWADAYARNGLDYYPKLIMAVPLSPVNGPRLLHAPDQDPGQLMPIFARAAEELCISQGWSSGHCLFPTDEQRQHFEDAGWLIRQGVQFHWHNRGYDDFTSFLDTLSSKKRKNIRRERRQAEATGLRFRMQAGDAISRDHWEAFHRYYEKTFLEHGNLALLPAGFFQDLGARLGQRVFMAQALDGERLVAGALFLGNDDVLYGRYWGCERELDGVHFEACYYQGIEHCIRNRIQRFEPGAQGTHKIARGFVPVRTWSAHWIADARFREAIGDFLHRETPAVERYRLEMSTHSPYKEHTAASSET